MNQQQKKTILSDPLNHFLSEHPNANEFELNKLRDLIEQRRVLKDQIKDAQFQSRSISRQIGETKRQGISIESLKHSMQTHSMQLKQLNEMLKELEQQLFECFKSDETLQETQTGTSSHFRTYIPPSLDPSQITISLLGNEIDEWNAYVERSPTASLYHRADWRQLIQETFGHDAIYCLAKNRQCEVVGVLPLIRLNSHLFGDFLISMPYFNYGGAISDHPLIEEQLMSFANEKAARLGVSHVEYRDEIERQGLPVQAHKVNMLLTLPTDPEQLWNSFSSKLRAQIRRPDRENPQVFFGRNDLVDDFYKVFSRNMRDLGTPVYTKRLFINILNTFPDDSRIICIKIGNKPVAAGFLLKHRNMFEIPWASTIKSVNPLSMNMLMYWEVLKFAIEQGIERFDFGRSTIDSGTFRFKRQWGAKPKQLFWHYWLNEGNEPPSLNPSNPKYALLIAIWKKLPVSLTRIIGPSIVKYLP